MCILNQFWATPKGLEGSIHSWSMEHAIRCECAHFLFSCAMGYLVFLLTLTICSFIKCKELGPYIWSISFVSGLLASVTMHMFIDAFTNLA